jgi:hypothetical protein
LKIERNLFITEVNASGESITIMVILDKVRVRAADCLRGRGSLLMYGAFNVAPAFVSRTALRRTPQAATPLASLHPLHYLTGQGLLALRSEFCKLPCKEEIKKLHVAMQYNVILQTCLNGPLVLQSEKK